MMGLDKVTNGFLLSNRNREEEDHSHNTKGSSNRGEKQTWNADFDLIRLFSCICIFRLKNLLLRSMTPHQDKLCRRFPPSSTSSSYFEIIWRNRIPVETKKRRVSLQSLSPSSCYLLLLMGFGWIKKYVCTCLGRCLPIVLVLIVVQKMTVLSHVKKWIINQSLKNNYWGHYDDLRSFRGP